MLDAIFAKIDIDDKLGEMNNPVYQRSFEGPLSFSLDGLANLELNEEFKKFNAKVGGYGGLLFELMNLIGNDLVTISALLSLEFNQIFLPSEVGTILSLLEKIKVITRKY